MSDSKLSALTALGAAPASGDLVYLVDISPTPDESKSITVDNLVRQYLESQTSIAFDGATTISTTAGDLTLDPAGSILIASTVNGQGYGLTNLNTLDVNSMFAYEYYEAVEWATPAAPAANRARIYAKDNGAGKTQLIARFPTGAEQVLATEP